jgi:hypothetical protein
VRIPRFDRWRMRRKQDQELAREVASALLLPNAT